MLSRGANIFQGGGGGQIVSPNRYPARGHRTHFFLPYPVGVQVLLSLALILNRYGKIQLPTTSNSYMQHHQNTL